MMKTLKNSVLHFSWKTFNKATLDLEINRIIHRHRYVIEKLGIGIAEFRDNLNLKDSKELTQAEEKIHYFLDRFLINRTAAKLLCHQHCKHFNAWTLLIFVKYNTRPPFRTKPIDNRIAAFNGLTWPKLWQWCQNGFKPNVKRKWFMRFVLVLPKFRYFKRKVDLNITCWDGEAEAACDKIEMIYIPVHLEDIAYNIIKNAMRATIQHNHETTPPVTVLISKGKNNVTIRVSDCGGGASLAEQQRFLTLVFYW